VSLSLGGAATLTLSGTGLNTYAGTTTIASPQTLQGGALNAFNATSATTVNGTLDLGGFDQTIGSLAGTGSVSNSGGAAAALTTGGNGTTTAFSGVIQDGANKTTSCKPRRAT
jgi:fibronectin-binding autotransporter adhesin